MKRQTNKSFPSEYITNFLNFISEAESSYNFCSEEMTKQEKLTQDYLHTLELGELSYKDRAKVATQLATNRRDRRYYKDKVEELQPIIEFVSKPENRRVFKGLEQILGVVRKAENYHKNRFYVPKVLKEKEIMVKQQDICKG